MFEWNSTSWNCITSNVYISIQSKWKWLVQIGYKEMSLHASKGKLDKIRQSNCIYYKEKQRKVLTQLIKT